MIFFFHISIFPHVSLQHFSLTPSVRQQVMVDHVITVFPPCVCVVAVLNSTSRETQPRPIYSICIDHYLITFSQTPIPAVQYTCISLSLIVFFILQYILKMFSNTNTNKSFTMQHVNSFVEF